MEHNNQKLINKYIINQNRIVLHVVNSKNYSGLEKVACDIIENIEEYKFIYVTQDGPIVETLKEKNVDYEIINKMSVKEIKRVIKKYNPIIIHAHDFTASIICSLVKGKIPLIEHLHNNSPWLKKISINSFAFLYAGLKADKILTVSESIEKEYVFSKFIKNKITCIGNPVSVNSVLNKVKKEDYKKKYDICCVARLTKQKNPQKFIEIIYEIKKVIPTINAIWVGIGELEEECKKLVKEKGLDDNIEFVGFQKNPYKYMASSKIFMLTSDWEGFGLVAFEALSLGLPSVVSNVGGLPNIVNQKCGLLASNYTEFVNETIKLLEDKIYYNEKQKESIKQSKKLDNQKKYMDNIKKIYNEVKTC